MQKQEFGTVACSHYRGKACWEGEMFVLVEDVFVPVSNQDLGVRWSPRFYIDVSVSMHIAVPIWNRVCLLLPQCGIGLTFPRRVVDEEGLRPVVRHKHHGHGALVVGVLEVNTQPLDVPLGQITIGEMEGESVIKSEGGFNRFFGEEPKTSPRNR